MNNGKYGWDKPSDNTLRLTLLHTPKTDKGYTYQDRQDFGYHTFTYSLLPHQGELDKAEVVSKAEVLNQTLKASRQISIKVKWDVLSRWYRRTIRT